jgi:hypothetical protein
MVELYTDRICQPRMTSAPGGSDGNLIAAQVQLGALAGRLVMESAGLAGEPAVAELPGVRRPWRAA